MKLKNSLLSYSMLFIIALFFGVSTLYSASPRMIIVEEGTNVGCGPCASMNPAFQEYLMEHLNEVIPIIYHSSWPSGQDPFYLNDVNMNNTRVSYYNINGVPSGVVNGTLLSNILPQTVEAQVSKYRDKTSPITITIDEQKNGNNVNFTVNVSSDNDLTSKKLRVVAVEFYHPLASGAAPNGETEFYWLARRMFPNAAGQDLNVLAGETFSYSNSFTIPTGENGWNADQVYLVAFVQDDSNKEILQAKSSQKLTQSKITTSNQFLRIDPESELSQTLTVSNPNDEDLEFQLVIKGENEGTHLPAGWSATLSETILSIPAGGSEDVEITFAAPDEAGFVFATIEAVPWGEDLGTVKKGSIAVFALSNKTKYVLYYGANRAATIAYSTFLNSLTAYKDKAAMLPLAEVVLDAYPVSSFDFAYFSFDYFSRGVMGTNAYSISSRVMSGISQMITDGKKLMITGELELLLSNGEQGSFAARNFFSNVLGIENSADTPFRVSVNNDGAITGILNFPFRGVDGDEIGDGVYLTLNNYSNLQKDPFIVTTDLIKKNANSTADLIGYYDNNQTRGAGVRKERDNGAKIVYLTFGLEAIKTEADRSAFMKKCVDWLFKSSGPGAGGKLAFDSPTLRFDAVEVGSSVTRYITFSNTGDGDLNISDIKIEWDDYGVFTFEPNQQKAMILAPGTEYELPIRFSPIAEEDFSAVVTIVSDAKNGNELSVFLEGKGGVGTGSKIASNAEDNIIDFGHIKITKNKEFNLKIYNTGNEDLELELIRISPNDDDAFEIIVEGNLYPYAIKPGDERVMRIRFSPTELRAYMGNLYIKSNAKNQPNYNIILTGECDPIGIISTNAVNSTVDFGIVNVTEKETFELVINNSSAESVRISSIEFRYNEDGAFSLSEGVEFPITIDVDEEKAVTVEFAPLANQAYTSTLRINTNSNAQPNIDVELKGQGYEPESVEDAADDILVLNASPNPARDQVNIEYTINGEQFREISIFLVNVQGIRVETMLEQVLLPGNHRFNFDLKNYPSGSYFIVAQIGNQIKRFPLSIVK